MWSMIGLRVKLINSLLFANVQCYWPRSETLREFVNCKWGNVIDHEVKLVNSLLFANVKCYWPWNETL